MNDLLKIINGDALTELKKLPSESVHCCVTSPPYWGLRDMPKNAIDYLRGLKEFNAKIFFEVTGIKTTKIKAKKQ